MNFPNNKWWIHINCYREKKTNPQGIFNLTQIEDKCHREKSLTLKKILELWVQFLYVSEDNLKAAL